MSTGLPSIGLPPIDPTFEPASVRNGSPATQKAYASALDFESMLVQQLSQSLTESSGLGGEGESGSGSESGSESEGGLGGSGSDPVSSQLSSLLPQTLTSSVMSHGGLGMAQQLMSSMAPAGETSAGESGSSATLPASGSSAITVGGGSLAGAPATPGVASAEVDPTGGVQA